MRAQWALAAVAVGLSGAFGAPAGLASAEDPYQLIARLESEGYTVNVDRIGTGPMSDCVVTNVRNPQTFTQLFPVRFPGNKDRVLVPVITSKTISVSLNCSR